MSTVSSPVILITGSIGGIGYATAQCMLAAGATVFVHGPTIPSARLAAGRLVAGGADPARIDVTAADFSRLDDVAHMAAQLSAQYEHIDVLVNNAAIAGPSRRSMTADGHEVTLQVNYLAPFLLTRLLTPALRAAEGRMVAVSSDLHRTGDITWSDPDRPSAYSQVGAYAQSKLALTMFARAMASEHRDVTAVSVHPGIANTDLGGIYGEICGPVDGAAAVVARLCMPEVVVVDGAYYDRNVPAVPATLVENPAAVARLWKLTTRMLGRHRFVRALAA